MNNVTTNANGISVTPPLPTLETNKTMSVSNSNFHYKSLKIYSNTNQKSSNNNYSLSTAVDLNELWKQEMNKMKQDKRNAIQDIKIKLSSDTAQQRHKYLLQ